MYDPLVMMVWDSAKKIMHEKKSGAWGYVLCLYIGRIKFRIRYKHLKYCTHRSKSKSEAYEVPISHGIQMFLNPSSIWHCNI